MKNLASVCIVILITMCSFIAFAEDPIRTTPKKMNQEYKLPPLDVYKITVASDIQKRWSPSCNLKPTIDNKFEAEISIIVLPDGMVKDIALEKRSGNDCLDKSAYQAIVDSIPLRPHPPGISKPYVKVGLRFHP